ncbi:MAG: bifunctional 5,10-methylenetetrahydrofolate dehydrogenase/5,10-methenyltetrahydrofolate cyclohydrolase [Bacilli bacterium]|nr:bifunctional 5,10-methylenetetrahydrofolate dehydrogenase/5,10-methenyltetrahydrofolate cyclohydrolase [Bacilli bacterium]
MKMELLDGRKVKKEKLQQLREKLNRCEEQVGLAVIQIGEDPASSVYVRQKEKMANDLGYYFKHIKLAENVTEEEVLSLIDQLNEDNLIDGILVQMPIPKHLDSKKIQNRIHYLKDVDGLTDINAGRLIHNQDTLVPCTPMGIMTLLEYYGIEVSGKNVVIVGRSDLVGKPLAALMTNQDATVTICHSKTKNLSTYTKQADILVVAVGKSNLIREKDVKEEAIIIDVGINRLEDGKLCGDVDFESVSRKASYITPVPGGVGQMTVYELGNNTYKAKMLRKKNSNL